MQVGGFQTRTKCLEDIPIDLEIKNEESLLKRVNIYPLSQIPSSKDSYAIVLKAKNPNKKGNITPTKIPNSLNFFFEVENFIIQSNSNSFFHSSSLSILDCSLLNKI